MITFFHMYPVVSSPSSSGQCIVSCCLSPCTMRYLVVSSRSRPLIARATSFLVRNRGSLFYMWFYVPVRVRMVCSSVDLGSTLPIFGSSPSRLRLGTHCCLWRRVLWTFQKKVSSVVLHEIPISSSYCLILCLPVHLIVLAATFLTSTYASDFSRFFLLI